jgi:hypothetical protein
MTADVQAVTHEVAEGSASDGPDHAPTSRLRGITGSFMAISPKRSEFPLPPADAARERIDDPDDFVRTQVLLPSSLLRGLLLVVAFATGTLANIALMIDHDERAWLATIPVISAVASVSLLLAWVTAVVANVRRVAPPSSFVDPPSPLRALAHWVIALATAASIVGAVVIVGDRTSGDARELWMALATNVGLLCGSIFLYKPFAYLGSLARRIGGKGWAFRAWFWAPLFCVGVGRIMIGIGYRWNDTFLLEDAGVTVGLIGVALPASVFALLMYRATGAMEDALAFHTLRAHQRPSLRFYLRSGFVPPSGFAAALDDHEPRSAVQLVPGPRLLRLLGVTALAGIALLSLVGGLVMVLFWREADAASLLPSQVDRAWRVVTRFREIERVVVLIALVLATLWALVVSVNARIVGRTKVSPLPAPLSIPLAALGVWIVGRSMVVPGESPTAVIVGLALQGAIVALPFLLLERVAESVGGRLTPLRIAYLCAVLLLVDIEGLGGLATIDAVADRERFGQMAGYLLLSALLLLLTTVAATDACRSLDDACRARARQRGEIVGQVSAAKQPPPLTKRQTPSSIPLGELTTPT